MTNDQEQKFDQKSIIFGDFSHFELMGRTLLSKEGIILYFTESLLMSCNNDISL